jgi:hypothetical protein
MPISGDDSRVSSAGRVLVRLAGRPAVPTLVQMASRRRRCERRRRRAGLARAPLPRPPATILEPNPCPGQHENGPASAVTPQCAPPAAVRSTGRPDANRRWQNRGLPRRPAPRQARFSVQPGPGQARVAASPGISLVARRVERRTPPRPGRRTSTWRGAAGPSQRGPPRRDCPQVNAGTAAAGRPRAPVSRASGAAIGFAIARHMGSWHERPSRAQCFLSHSQFPANQRHGTS